MLRFAVFFAVISVAFLIPFLIWGDRFDAVLTREGTVLWIQTFGGWGWLAGVVLLTSDLLLPIPSTIVMSALGYLYGPWVGGLLAALGSSLAGVLGYFLCRRFGVAAALPLVGTESLIEIENSFRRIGPWLVVFSRWLPLFPEVVACMAGLARMPFWIFLSALVCGSMPLGFAFALIGFLGVTRPLAAFALSAVLPPLLWLLARRRLLKPET